MDRFSNTFEALLAALADAVKQLGEGSQQPWARTRVEEAKQEFVNCCDVMCFHMKQAVEIIRQEMVQQLSSSGQTHATAMDAEQVRQILDAAEVFAAQLRDPVAAAAAATAAAGATAVATAAAAAAVAAAGRSGPAGSGPYMMAPPAAQLPHPGATDPAAAAASAVQSGAVGVVGYPQPPPPQQQQYQQGMGVYNAYM
ncbi:hypothetical protein VOLCADRAFT_121597 [Volvox carteri f. nagariensis]|uniref:Uncharacterized protein n=1 Tax=Volvox carteri f. nagariensis TaxID=3068 RepID=D8UEP7_VOLCA|nr:uncharacterized protein VOLCADRAFT_121597 [Volvox carteri f. nagariensis]EFJ41772.1 hypothetical protein VOLCADRAFT_121597 [Volvox carteri f. nagariensis]|eukprot:XP_002957118.1 hypothetical protein VOLCADRAFT_121597 [Volvox carteri f. nagariensis]